MAMRLYSKTEFEAALKDLGCHQTGKAFANAELWQTKNGKQFSAPYPDTHSGKYSQHVLYAVVEHVTKLIVQ